MPLLLRPSFFTRAISQALIPVVSKSYSDNNIIYTKMKIKQGILFSLVIGIPATLLFVLIPDIPLKIVYNTTKGINYIRLMAPICLLYYIQSPLTAGLQAMGKAKDGMTGTLLGVSVKLIVLIIGCNIRIGMMGLIASIIINIIVVTIYDYRKISKYLK